MMKILRNVLAVLNLCAFAALFAGPAFDELFPEATGVAARWLSWLPALQLIPAVLALDWIALLVTAGLTFFGGRLYCRIVCPLGAVQDLARGFTGVRRVCARLPETRVQRIFRWTVFALFLVVGALGLGFFWIDPYGIFGRAAALATAPEYPLGFTLFAGAVFGFVILQRWVGKGRFWCNWVCPVGTLLNLAAKFSRSKLPYDAKDGCGNCRACLKKPEASK